MSENLCGSCIHSSDCALMKQMPSAIHQWSVQICDGYSKQPVLPKGLRELSSELMKYVMVRCEIDCKDCPLDDGLCAELARLNQVVKEVCETGNVGGSK